MSVNLQKIEKSYSTSFDIARKYYKIICLLNDIDVTERELDLVAFSAVTGTVSTPPVRKQFMDTFGVSKAQVYNLTAKLQKMGIFGKDKDNKIRINKTIHPDFENNELIMAIKMKRDAT